MKQAAIYYKDKKAGILSEEPDGYTFTYDPIYLEGEQAKAISLTLPLQVKPYKSNAMFPFFDGLIPEGWLLDIAQQNWKIDSRDRMSLLMACCKDCIGTISIHAIKEEEVTNG